MVSDSESMKPLTPDLAPRVLRDSWKSFPSSVCYTGQVRRKSPRVSIFQTLGHSTTQGKQALCPFSIEEKRARLCRSTIKCAVIFFVFKGVYVSIHVLVFL